MAAVSLVHWTYKTDKLGHSPVKIAVHHRQERRYYAVRLKGSSTNLYLSKKQFENSSKFRTDLGKALKTELKRAEASLPNPFSWVRFEAVYKNAGRSFFEYFEAHLESLKDRPGTYLSYKQALKKWISITDDFQPIELLGQLHILEASCAKKSTAGIYLRATRAVYNFIRKDFPDYPVWNYRISSKTATHKARTLTLEELRLIVKAKNLTPAQKEARRIFMISFFMGGMNLIDLLNLKWSDIKKDRVVFVRQKTKLSVPTPIEIPLTKELKQYLGKENGSLYVIANFNRAGSLVQQRISAKSFIRNINRRLEAIAEAIGIEPFSTYSARHTFASLLKFNGIDTARISELLGHKSISTTEAYLRQFDIKNKSKAIATINLN